MDKNKNIFHYGIKSALLLLIKLQRLWNSCGLLRRISTQFFDDVVGLSSATADKFDGGEENSTLTTSWFQRRRTLRKTLTPIETKMAENQPS